MKAPLSLPPTPTPIPMSILSPCVMFSDQWKVYGLTEAVAGDLASFFCDIQTTINNSSLQENANEKGTIIVLTVEDRDGIWKR